MDKKSPHPRNDWSNVSPTPEGFKRPKVPPPAPPHMRVGECGDRFDSESGTRIKHADYIEQEAAIITHHDRYNWCRRPENGTKLWNIVHEGNCGSNMDDAIDRYILGERSK